MANLGQNLSMQTAMRQNMAQLPQMIQSMELLQLPILDLEQRITREVLENPALELGEMQGEARAAEDGDAPAPAAGESADYGDNIDCDWDNVYERDNFSAPSGRGGGGEDDDERFDALTVAEGRDLPLDEYLRQQLGLLKLDARLWAMCEEIIGGLDRNGYFTGAVDKLGAALNPPADAQERGWALAAVQSLQPTGVAATSPGECLALQLRALEPPDPDTAETINVALKIVSRHLEDLAANKLPKIAGSLKVPIERVKAALKTIQSLSPFPGRAYGAPPKVIIRPDVFITLEPATAREREQAVEASHKAHDRWQQARNALAAGRVDEREARAEELAAIDAETAYQLFNDDGTQWTVSSAEGAKVEISEAFLAIYDKSGRGEAIRARWNRDPRKKAELAALQEAARANSQLYREKYYNANNIVWAVNQREITITRITREIVAAQKDYLAGRAPVPAPLMMKDVAAKLDMDTGTVSRAVDEKYADTPLGLRPLREFFVRATATLSAPPPLAADDAGSETAAAAAPAPAGGTEEIGNILVQQRIKALIDAEDKHKPLKDDVIQDLLAKEGIRIARRTVAKHRGLLGFPNYSQRREY